MEAIQAFGGNGYTRDYPVERLLRDAKWFFLKIIDYMKLEQEPMKLEDGW